MLCVWKTLFQPTHGPHLLLQPPQNIMVLATTILLSFWLHGSAGLGGTVLLVVCLSLSCGCRETEAGSQSLAGVLGQQTLPQEVSPQEA